MTDQNPFDEYMNLLSQEKGEPETNKFTCENVHPIINEYVDLITNDLLKIDPDIDLAIEKKLSDGINQMIECFVGEIVSIFDEQIESSIELAKRISDLDDDDDFTDEELEEAVEFIEKNGITILDNGDYEYQDDDDRPLMLPMYALKLMLRRAFQFGYLIMPGVASHLE